MKRAWNLVGILVVIGLLIYVLKDIDFYEVYNLLTQVNIWWFFLAVFCTICTFLVWNYRSIYITKKYFEPNFWYFLKVLFAGSFFNTITPGGGIGGEPFRAHYISRKYKKPVSKVLGYVLGDTFFRMSTLIFFAIFSVLFIFFYINVSPSLKLILEAILVGSLCLSGVVLFFTLKKFNFNFARFFSHLYVFSFFKSKFESKDHFEIYLGKRIRNFSRVFRKVVKNKNNLVVGLTLSVIFWTFNFATAYFLFFAFGFPVHFLSVLIVFTLGNIIGSFFPVPGGVGVTESSMTVLYTAMGIPISVALLAAFLQRIIYYFFSIVVGGICFLSLGRQNGKFWSLF